MFACLVVRSNLTTQHSLIFSVSVSLSLLPLFLASMISTALSGCRAGASHSGWGAAPAAVAPPPPQHAAPAAAYGAASYGQGPPKHQYPPQHQAPYPPPAHGAPPAYPPQQAPHAYPAARRPRSVYPHTHPAALLGVLLVASGQERNIVVLNAFSTPGQKKV